ncbi:MAG: hypothetical protein AMXMBFR53_22440 [Gemmatimonadota bacterium]
MGFHLCVLGGLDLKGPDGGEVRSVLAHPKRFALLAYLALASPRGYRRRDALFALLWPDQDTEHARASLRQALHGLRRSLGDDALLTRADEVALAAPLFSCDVWAFETAVARKDDDTAAGLYTGDLLAGFFLEDAQGFEQWVDAERARLRRGYLEVLERIARRYEQSEPLRAVEVWRRLAELDPYSSRFAVAFMCALEAAGDAPAAVRHAELHTSFVNDELEAEPDPEVTACAARLRHGGDVVSVTHPSSPRPEPAADGPGRGAHVDVHPAGAVLSPAPGGTAAHGGEPPQTPTGAGRAFRRWGRPAAAAATVAILAAAWTMRPPPTPPPSVARYALAFPEGQEPLNRAEATIDVGRGGTIVYLGPGESGPLLWVKLRERAEAYPLPGTEGARVPTLSPDGLEVAFYAGLQLKKVSLVNGGVVTLADSALWGGVAWLEDGGLVYTGLQAGGGPEGIFPLLSLPEDGGAPTEVWPACPDGMIPGYPVALPGGRGLLVGIGPWWWPTSSIWVVDLRTGEGRELIPDAMRAWYIESGHIVYVRRNGAVFAAPFDARSLELGGPEAPVLGGVSVEIMYPDLAVAPDGTVLLLESTGVLQPREMVWLSRSGAVLPVDPSWRHAPPEVRGFALSPDGKRLAIGANTEEGDDIWIKELDRGPLLRLTTSPTRDFRPAWTPDGESVLFVSGHAGEDGAGLQLTRADGTGAQGPVSAGPEMPLDATMSADGNWIVFRTGGFTDLRGGRDLYAQRVGADEGSRPLLTSTYDEMSPSLSPDGRWLAYASNESGELEVYVRPFPDVGAGKWVISQSGGHSPHWGHGGQELFYVSANREMVAARVRTEDGVRVVARSALFRIPDDVDVGTVMTPYDVTPDDQRFIMARRMPGAEARLLLIENFAEEVKRALAGRDR